MQVGELDAQRQRLHAEAGLADRDHKCFNSVSQVFLRTNLYLAGAISRE